MRDGDAQVFLLAMQHRLLAEPRLALGLAPNANAADVRTAFLTLTKQYHPVKFARCDATVQRLANEVFLLLREAHDAVAKNTRSAVGTGRTTVAGAASTTGPVGVVAATKTTSPSPIVGRTPTPRAPSGVTLPRTISPLHTQAQARVASTAPAQPAIGPTPSIKPVVPMPAAARPPGAQPSATPAKPLSPAAKSVTFRATPTAPSPASIITANTVNETELFTKGKELLRQKNWHEARDIFVGLTRHNTTESAYKAMLALARGRIDQANGNLDGARTQYSLALQLEPAFTAAATALDEIRPIESKSSLWSKLRGK